MSETKLKEMIGAIKPLDCSAMDAARKRWNSIAKPLYSLGSLEDAIVQIAGITADADVYLEKRVLQQVAQQILQNEPLSNRRTRFHPFVNSSLLRELPLLSV